MATKGPVPVGDADLLTWLPQFGSKLGTYAVLLGIPQQDVDSVKADAAMVEWTLKVLPSMRASAQQLTAFKDDLLDGQPGTTPQTVPIPPEFPKAPAAVLDGIVPRTRTLVQRIKKANAYTEAIGKDLGLVATAPLTDVAPKPTFRGTALPNSEVRLDWVKKGYSGVLVQGKRPGDADWVALGRDNYSPYTDGRPPVTAGANETRQYRMRYLQKDDEVGEWSDVVVVVTIA